jgi:hypothetical protein
MPCGKGTHAAADSGVEGVTKTTLPPVASMGEIAAWQQKTVRVSQVTNALGRVWSSICSGRHRA